MKSLVRPKRTLFIAPPVKDEKISWLGLRHRSATVITALLLGLITMLTFSSCVPPSRNSSEAYVQQPGDKAPAGESQAPAVGSDSTATVYWVGAGGGHLSLYADRVPASATASDPLTAAAAALMSNSPADSSLSNLWSRPSRLAVSSSANGAINVDVSADAVSKRGTNEQANMAVQQLVYTLQSAATKAGILDAEQPPVLNLSVDGKPDGEVFGKLKLDGSIPLDPKALAGVSIVSPGSSDVVKAGTVKVNGKVGLGMAKATWVVERVGAAGERAMVSSGTLGVGAEAHGDFLFRTSLSAGSYLLTVNAFESTDAKVPEAVAQRILTVHS